MGLTLAEQDVAALEARTEGWIAGLQLAALSMQGRDDAAGFIQAFAIGFIEAMAFLASAYIGHGRRQVNVLQTVLYVVGLGLCALPILGRRGSPRMAHN